MAIKLRVAGAEPVRLGANENETLRLGTGEGEQGTRNYDELYNKPQINGVTLEGDKNPAELGVQGTDKLVQTVSASSTADEYPSARALWNQAAKYAKCKRFVGSSVPGGVFTLNSNNIADIYNAQTSGGQIVFIFDEAQKITYRVNYCFIDRTDPAHERIVVYAVADHVDTTQGPNYGISGEYQDALYIKAAATSQMLIPITRELQEKLTFDETPNALSENPVTSRGIASALSGKQNTIADLDTIRAGAAAGATALQSESDPVFSASAAAGITAGDITAWNGKQNALTFDDAPTENSTNPVKSGGVYTALGGKQDAGDYAAAKAGDTTKTALATASIPFAQVDATSTATVFTATVPGITEYRDGVSFWLRNGVVTSAAGFTVNINGLGALKCFNNMAPTTQDTTLFNVNYTMLFVYCSWLNSGHGALLMYRGYDANTNTIGYQIRTNSGRLPMKSVTYRYRLFFTAADGKHFVPANNSTSTNATSSRTVCQDAIDPHGPIFYYGTTASVAAGAKPSAAYLWQQYTLTLGYSFNRTGAALVLDVDEPLYIKAAPQADGSAIIDATTPYVQTLPTTADGFIYIFLGYAYSTTQIELQMTHPVYHFYNGAIRLWTGPV